MKQPWSGFEPTVRWRIWGSRPSPQKTVFGWILLATVSAATVWIGADLWSLWNQRQQTSVEYINAQNEAQQAYLVAQQTATNNTNAETTSLDRSTRNGLNQVVRRLGIPWPGVFETLERLTPPNIALIRMEPDGNGMISIEAESTDIDKVLAYASGLENQGIFGTVSLRRHATNDRDPNLPTRLTFLIVLKERQK